MKTNVFLLLLIAICVVFNSACLKDDEVNQEIVELSDVKINDGKNNEVVMTDSDTEKRLPPVPTFGEQKEGTNYVSKDGSTIRVGYDGQGNRVETRYFFNHPNLKMLVVTVSNDETIKEGVVYGHNNENKNLPSDLVDKALTTSGDEIASKVGITSKKIVNSPQTTKRNTVYNPSNPTYPKIPDPRIQPQTQPQQPENVESETEEEPNPPTEEKPTVDKEKKENGIDNNREFILSVVF